MLQWLNPDREQAAKKYEAIRHRLIEILASRGCYEAEHWTDVVIDRVVSRIDKATDGYQGDPAYYFCGVAKKVFLEYLKKRTSSSLPPPLPPPNDALELEHGCLEECRSQLPDEDRDLIQSYYCEQGRRKIENRNDLAKKLGIGLNALRIRTHRIRIVLRRCIEDCITRKEI